jgi:hypothetical protein
MARPLRCVFGFHRWIEGACAGSWCRDGRCFCAMWLYRCDLCGREEEHDPVAEAYGRL